MITRLRAILIFGTILTGWAVGADWQKAYEQYADRMVVVEYYEVSNTFHSIQNRERTKRFLTGFVVNDSGLVLTSASIFRAKLEIGGGSSFFHGAQKPTDIRVRLSDGKYVPAEFLGKDDDLGLGFVQMESTPYIKPVRFTDKGRLHRGEKILVIQHLPQAYDFEPLVSEKIINAIVKGENERYLCEGGPMALSSFGLVVNTAGQAVGVVHGAASYFGSMFARSSRSAFLEMLPFTEFKKLIDHPPVFREKQTSRKNWLGVYMQPFTEAMARYFGADTVQGVLINTIFDDSPAQKAGLQIGDVVTAVNGQPVPARTESDLQLFRKLIREAERQRVELKIFRKNKWLTLQVTLGEIPISQFLAEEASDETLGFSVKELTRDIILAKHLDFDTEGVWVSRVERAGWADIAGLQIGDLILSVNEVKINTLDDMRKILESISQRRPAYVALFIKRGPETRFLFIKTDYSQS